MHQLGCKPVEDGRDDNMFQTGLKGDMQALGPRTCAVPIARLDRRAAAWAPGRPPTAVFHDEGDVTLGAADRGRCGDPGQCVPSASPRTGGRSRRRSSSVPAPGRCSLRLSSRRRQSSSSCPSRCSRRSECRQATPESHVTHETWRTSRVSSTRWRFSVTMFLGVIVVSSAMRAATASSMSPFIAEAFPWLGQRGRWSAIAMARHVQGRVTESLTAAWDWWQERHMKVMGRVPGGAGWDAEYVAYGRDAPVRVHRVGDPRVVGNGESDASHIAG